MPAKQEQFDNETPRRNHSVHRTARDPAPVFKAKVAIAGAAFRPHGLTIATDVAVGLAAGASKRRRYPDFRTRRRCRIRTYFHNGPN